MSGIPALELSFVCVTCGTQYPPSAQPPQQCPICQDGRQYVGWEGQQWTTLDTIRGEHQNVFTPEEPGLHSIKPEPSFGIGQRAFLVQTPEGNLLWDCVALLDEDTVRQIRDLGGLRAIAISHPHYYTTMIEWSRAFGDVPIYLHEAEREWVMRPDPRVRFWSGETRELWGGLKLIRTGGHFPGYQVLHWPEGADGQGVLLAGDQPQVAMDRRWVSFMWSYPNMVPLSAGEIRRIVAALEPLNFERLYGAFVGRMVASDAKAAVLRSAERYLERLSAP